MKYIVVIISCLLCFSCRKEADDNSHFKYLSIEESYGLVLGKYINGIDTVYKIFELNDQENLEEVKYLNEDKSEINFNRYPVAIYNLNTAYFLINFKYGNQNSIESYLIRRFDGSSRKLPVAVAPEHSGELDYRNNTIRHDQSSRFYYYNSSGNWRLDLSNEQDPKVEEILKGEELNDHFTVDYLGNILSDKKLYPVQGNVTNLNNSNSSNVYPLESFSNSMYYIFRSGDSIQCSKIKVDKGISEENLFPSFKLTNDEAGFVCSHAFPSVDKIAVILSKAILVIEGNTIKKVNMENLNLNKIISSFCSGDYCFVYGENAVNTKVLVRIDLSSSNPVFTQIIAPNDIEIRYFSVSSANDLMFSGLRMSDSKKLFGYIPFNRNTKIIEDDKGISEIQVVVR